MTQLINEIETKIQETQLLITNYRNELTNKENTLQTLINQLQEIKKTMKITNKNNALDGEINTK